MAEHASATITIKAAPADVMAVIADIDAYPQWSGPVEKAEVLSRDPAGRPERAAFQVDAKITKDEYTLAYHWDELTVSWDLVEGKQQNSQHGSYTLRESGDGTEVQYDLTVDLKIKVPGILAKKFQSGVMSAALKDLKKRLES